MSNSSLDKLVHKMNVMYREVPNVKNADDKLVLKIMEIISNHFNIITVNDGLDPEQQEIVLGTLKNIIISMVSYKLTDDERKILHLTKENMEKCFQVVIPKEVWK